MIRKLFIFTLLIGMMLGLCITPAEAADPPVLAPTTVTYNLYATDGYVTLADGTVSYIYGFIGGKAGTTITYLDKAGLPQQAPLPDPTGGPITVGEKPLAGNAQFPAPVIYATTDDVVEIRLKNLGVTVASAPNDPHTIHLHGLDVEAANDGVPETSVAAVPANAKKTPGAGNVVVYMFAPTHAGTYMYHCHQEASIHVQMGMYGALVVYEPGDAAAVHGPGTGSGTLHGWQYDRDYILLLSEFDMGQHVAEEKGGPFNPVNFRPQYWFINGLSFPNTVHAGLGFNWQNWIAAHPGYDPFIVGSVSGGASGTGEKILLRVINMGFQVQPMHMHGFHGKIIGSDQRAWDWANEAGVTPFGEGMEKNTLTIGSGETYEWLIDFGQQTLYSTYADGSNVGSFPGGTQTRYTVAGPTSNTSADPAIPDPFIPPFTYIGGPIVGPAATNLNDNPELPRVEGQFFPFHNHDDYKATNNGVYPGGMFTMLLTTP